MYKIGIDVGGTNTDAVILDHQLNLIHSVKVPTTDDIQTGIAGALNKVLAESAVDPTKVTHAMLGTTQCTNAIVETKKLSKSWGSFVWAIQQPLRSCLTQLGPRI